MNIKNSTLNFSRNSINSKYLEIIGSELLEGNIKVSGAKNSALVLIAASILSKVKLLFLMFLEFQMF